MKYKWDKKTLYLIPPKGLTKEQTFYWKVKWDKKWYIEKFLKIKDKKANLVPFKFNKAQEYIYEENLKCLRDGRLPRFIVLKSRQQGISTWSEGMFFADTATNQYKNTFIIAHEQTASSALFNMSKLFYFELPNEIKPAISKSNEKALVFENKDENSDGGLRSKFTIGTANTTEGGRGNTFHNLHVSEMAFFPQPEKTLTAIIQAVPDMMNTMIIYESTANGVGDYFHKQWLLSKQGKSDFIPIFLPWCFDPTCSKEFRSESEKTSYIEEVVRVNLNSKREEIHTPEYDLMKEYELTYEQLNWRQWAINNKCGGSIDMFHQEYPINDTEAFISSGRPVFNIETVKLYENIAKTPSRGFLEVSGGSMVFREDDKGYVSIWQHPVRGKNYSIGADVAEGLIHGDYSVGCVGDDEFNIIAEWHGHIDPDLFGEELVKLARYYNNAYIGVENNNHGLTTLKSIQRLDYYDIYYSKMYDKITNAITSKMGWSTNMRTKPMMIDKLAEFVRERYLGMWGQGLIDEMYTYVIDDAGRTNAQAGCHDDRVMATAVLLQVLLENRGSDYTPEDSNKNDRKKRSWIDKDDIKQEVAI